MRSPFTRLASVMRLAAGCCTTPSGPSPATSAAALADAFLAAVAQHCGQAYRGRIVANVPAPDAPTLAPADPFEGKALVMHVRGCDEPKRE